MLKSLLGRVGILSVGTGIGQGMIVISSPYLTNIYTAENFGWLGLILAYCNIASAVACFKYDLALTTAKDEDIPNLIFLSILSVLATAAIAITINSTLKNYAPNLSLETSIIFLAVGLPGLLQIITSIAISQNNFIKLSILRMVQGFSYVGLAGFKIFPLISAHLFSIFLAILIGIIKIDFRFNFKDHLATIKKYKKYQTLLLPGALLDVLGYSAIGWVIIERYGLASFGEISLLQKIVGAPVLLLSMSLGQVLLKHCQQNSSSASLNKIYIASIKLYSLLGLFFLTIVIFFGSNIVGFLINKNWNINNIITISILTAILFRTLASPLSNMLLIKNRQDLIFTWQLGYFLGSTSLYCFALHLNLTNFIIVYALHESLQYTLYLFYIKRAIK
jgi:O-antigen/teichoic acid export membrane protein